MLLKYIVLGVLQGLTEFLPVSSSGHLVIAKVYSNLPGDMAFDVLLHLASALAIIIYFHNDILNLVKAVFRGLYNLICFDFKALKNDSWFCLGLFIVLASFPAGLVGIFLEDRIENFFSSEIWVAIFLIITGFVISSSRWADKKNSLKTGSKEPEKISLKQALIVGFFQAFALMPGVSRSGTTITAGMWSGISREEAGRFSFLLGLPAILGAGILKMSAIINVSGDMAGAYIAGSIASFIVSFVALVILFKILKTKYFSWFSFYCWGLGLAIILLKIF